MKKLLPLLVLIAACSGSIHDQPLTGENWEGLKNSSALTMQEAQFLNAYVMSQGMRSALDTTEADPFAAGLTIGEAIEEGRRRVDGMSDALNGQ
jgi:hypothetical protein